MGDTVLIDHPAEGVTRLTLNRPDRMNTLTYELVDDMHAELPRQTSRRLEEPLTSQPTWARIVSVMSL